MLNAKLESKMNKAIVALNATLVLYARINQEKWDSQSARCIVTNDRIITNFFNFKEKHSAICDRNKAKVEKSGKTTVKMVTSQIRKMIEAIIDVEDVCVKMGFYNENWSLNENFNDMFEGDVEEQREIRSILNDLSTAAYKGGKLTQALVGVENLKQGGMELTQKGILVATDAA